MTAPFRAIAVWLCLAPIALAQDGSEAASKSRSGPQEVDWVDVTTQWIESIKRSAGSPPTDRQFAERVVAAHASYSEVDVCWEALLKAHRAIVSKQDLIELIDAKRTSIHDIRCKYTYRQEELDVSNALAVVFRAENSFFRSGGKLRMHSSWQRAGSKPVVSEHCYNGSFVQYVNWSLNTPNASIHKLQGYSDYYRIYDVLANAMLLDCDIDLGVLHLRPYDLLELLSGEGTLLLQELEDVEGRMCLVVTDGGRRAYLDVQRDFSVVRLDGEKFVFDGGKAIGYRLEHTRRFEGVTDHGNGIWLPHTMETTFLKDGKVWNRQRTEVLELAVNEGVDNSVFENIIPKGAFVFDSIRDASYRYGEDASIEGTLDATVRGGTRRFQWVLVMVNVVAICVVAWVFWRRRKSNVRQ